MLQSVISELGSVRRVAAFQRWCGVEQVAATPREDATSSNGCDHRSSESADDGSGTGTQSLPRSTRHSKIPRPHHHAPLSNADSPADRCAPHPQSVPPGVVAVNGCVNDVVNNCVKDGGLCTCEHYCSVSNGVCSCNQPAPDQREKYPSNGSASLPDGTRVPPPASSSSTSHSTGRRVGKRGSDEGGSEVQSMDGPPSSPPRVVIHYPLLYYWARLGAALGNEQFYVSVMPLMLWAVDSVVVRQTAVLWWLVMYVGQALKDYLGWPRPRSPPVVHLETTYLAEFSMPSTHAMAGTAIPLLMATLLLERYQLPVVAVVCVAVFWCGTTCLSRVYLGVHTILDVVCGVLLAVAMYLPCRPLIPLYDDFQQTHPLAPLLLLLISLALCTVCYPSSSRQSAKEDAIIVTAVVVGAGIGAWLNFQLGFTQKVPPGAMPMPVPLPTAGWLLMAVLQFVVGVAVVVVVKVLVKPVMVSLLCVLLGVGRGELPHSGVTVGYKYTTYLCLGLAFVFLDPLLFTLLGFGRPGYYQEVI